MLLFLILYIQNSNLNPCFFADKAFNIFTTKLNLYVYSLLTSIILFSDLIKIYNQHLQNTFQSYNAPLIFTIKRIEYVRYSSYVNSRSYYEIFAKDQHNNTYEISHLFDENNNKNKSSLTLECKSGISFKAL